MSAKQPSVAMVSHLNRRSPLSFCVRHWPEAFHRVFHSVNLSFHVEFHSINLSKDCFFISNQIGSNVAKDVFEAGDGRSPIVIKQRGCLVDILGSVRTNSNNGVQDFWLWASD